MRKILFWPLLIIALYIGWGAVDKFGGPLSDVDWRNPQKAIAEIWYSLRQQHAPSEPQKIAACHERLLARGVDFEMALESTVKASQKVRGCHKDGAVKIREIDGVSFGGEITLSCPAALAMADWIIQDLQDLAEIKFQQPVKRINHMGTYQCRKIAGSKRMSEHSYANAIDVSGFVLENGKRISVLKNWSAPAKEADFLKSVGRAACGRFNLTLSPDYNEAHRDHFHLDMGVFRRCRINADKTS